MPFARVAYPVVIAYGSGAKSFILGKAADGRVVTTAALANDLDAKLDAIADFRLQLSYFLPEYDASHDSLVLLGEERSSSESSAALCMR